MKYKKWSVFGSLVVATILAAGCGGPSAGTGDSSSEASSQSIPAPAAASVPDTDAGSAEHGHKSGAHGGIMVSLGRDSYHAEAVFEQGGVLRLYTLGKDESRVIDVEKQSLKGFAKVEGSSEAQPFSLEPEPQAGDAADRTSQFVGTLPSGMSGINVEITVPNLTISGERFRLGFKSTSAPHAEEMPKPVVEKEEQDLYLTPGGLYTEEDIQANGRTTAAAKFQGIRSTHDAQPSPGDKLCPISMTKANPKFSWIVGGKAYEFCCPPCVDEFIKKAKSSPNEIKEPGEYVKPLGTK